LMLLLAKPSAVDLLWPYLG